MIYKVKRGIKRELGSHSKSVDDNLVKERDLKAKLMFIQDLAYFDEGVTGLKQENKRKSTGINAIIIYNVNWCLDLYCGIVFLARNILFLFKGNMKMIYHSVILALLGCFYFYIPIELAFEIQWNTFYLLSIYGIIFLISFIGELLLCHKQQKKKLTKISICELLALIFFIIFIQKTYENYKILWCLLFLLFKLPSIFNHFNIIKSKMNLNENIECFFSISAILFRILCFTNFTTCIWIYLGTHFNQESNFMTTILIDNPLISLSNLYLRCFCANLANFTMVGLNLTQNLVIPLTSIELFYTCLINIAGVFLFVSNLSFFHKIWIDLNKKTNQNLKDFELILKNKGMNFEERKQYTEEAGLILKKNENYENFQKIVNSMPESSQQSLLKKIYSPIINKIPVLAENFSKEFLAKLMHYFKIHFYTDNENLFKVIKI